MSYGFGDDEDDDDEGANNANEGGEDEEEEEGEEMEEEAAPAPSADNSGAQSPRRPSPVGSTEEEEPADAAVASTNRSSLDQELATSLSRSVQNLAPSEIEIPPAPAGRCSQSLIQKINDTREKMRLDPHFDINLAIQGNKAFRNPSIYDKIVDFLGIDEKGTNYPPVSYAIGSLLFWKAIIFFIFCRKCTIPTSSAKNPFTTNWRKRKRPKWSDERRSGKNGAKLSSFLQMSSRSLQVCILRFV